ncbi:SMI1/KNR4 family protein [Streptomyces sp. NBC_00829]|uniref:SMI1/KNR4 family protein n=1 Tax=Streptomyces sp. NBC_00829 TaxID=2903679 RepID=UPI003870D701|nr:SMI1/KNR4 family protein [Streptomyces sp. NBC_00829]
MMDDEAVEAVRNRAAAGDLPAPATLAAVMEAERTIGFPLTPLLRRLYLEVANGGFGPPQGILGVRGGAPQADWNDLAELYQEGPDPSGLIPAGLVPVYDWGCTIWSLVDFRDPVGPMWCNHEGEIWPQGINLAEWLVEAMAGRLTVHSILDSEPAH